MEPLLLPVQARNNLDDTEKESSQLHMILPTRPGILDWILISVLLLLVRLETRFIIFPEMKPEVSNNSTVHVNRPCTR